MKTRWEIYEGYYKKLKAKQKKAIDSLKYYVEWSGDMMPREDGKFDVLANIKVKTEIIEKIINNEPIELKTLENVFKYAYIWKREYELWTDEGKMSNLYDDGIIPELENIYNYVKKVINE